MNIIIKVGIRASVAALIIFAIYSLSKKIVSEREEIYLSILKEPV